MRPADIIVISTGFKVTEMAARLNISGRDGKSAGRLGQRQSDRLSRPDRAGFPELLLMLGPNSGPAHGGSVIFQSECQSRYISACLSR